MIMYGLSDLISLEATIPNISVQSIVDDQWGVEGLYSQQFSVGIFIFLFACIIMFTMIVIKFMNSGSQSAEGAEKKKLKTGEKIMFAWIFLGIIGALIMAVMQLLQGYLF